MKTRIVPYNSNDYYEALKNFQTATFDSGFGYSL